MDEGQTLFGSYYFDGRTSVVGDLDVESICGVNVEETLRDTKQTITGKLVNDFGVVD